MYRLYRYYRSIYIEEKHLHCMIFFVLQEPCGLNASELSNFLQISGLQKTQGVCVEFSKNFYMQQGHLARDGAVLCN